MSDPLQTVDRVLQNLQWSVRLARNLQFAHVLPVSRNGGFWRKGAIQSSVAFRESQIIQQLQLHKSSQFYSEWRPIQNRDANNIGPYIPSILLLRKYFLIAAS